MWDLSQACGSGGEVLMPNVFLLPSLDVFQISKELCLH